MLSTAKIGCGPEGHNPTWKNGVFLFPSKNALSAESDVLDAVCSRCHHPGVKTETEDKYTAPEVGWAN